MAIRVLEMKEKSVNPALFVSEKGTYLEGVFFGKAK